MRGLQVLQEGQGPFMKEEVWWLVKPLVAMPVPVGLTAEGVATGARIEEVSQVTEGMGGPASPTSKLVHEDVWMEAAGVVGSEGVAHCEAEGSGGGVSGVDQQRLTGLWVHVLYAHTASFQRGWLSLLGGSMMVCLWTKKGWGQAQGQWTTQQPSRRRCAHGRLLCSTQPTECGSGRRGGDTACSKCLKVGGRVGRPVKDGWRPYRGEPDGQVLVDEGGEGGVKAKALTLIDKTPRVGHTGKGGQTPTQEVNM